MNDQRIMIQFVTVIKEKQTVMNLSINFMRSKHIFVTQILVLEN